jgi:hypothetical protein
VIIRRLIVPLTFAVVALHAGQAFAQDAFPAPLPGQAATPARDAVPPEKWSASDTCWKGFAPLREEAEKNGKLIKAASERHAPPDEACMLIGNYGQSESKMIKYVEAYAAKCGIPPQIAEQLKAGHKNTEKIQKQVCTVARQAQGRIPAGPVGDFWPASKREPAGPVGDFDHLVPHR